MFSANLKILNLVITKMTMTRIKKNREKKTVTSNQRDNEFDL